MTMTATIAAPALLDSHRVAATITPKRGGDARPCRVMLCEVARDCSPLLIAFAEGVDLHAGDVLGIPMGRRTRRLPLVREAFARNRGGLCWWLCGDTRPRKAAAGGGLMPDVEGEE